MKRSGSVSFGFYPESCCLRAGDVEINDLPNLGDAVQGVRERTTTHDDWIYAPLQRRSDFVTDEVTMLPYTARVFDLPTTHELVHHQSNVPEHLAFLVWCMSFFTGMRLTTTEAGFLDATPIKPGKLTDFSVGVQSLAHGIDLADRFWRCNVHDQSRAGHIAGIVHCLFLAQSPRNLDCERLMYLYIALDACWALLQSLCTSVRSTNHASRTDAMCRHFGLETPRWARPNAEEKDGTEISVARNNTFHEALFFGQPLGFALYGHGSKQGGDAATLLQIEALVLPDPTAPLSTAIAHRFNPDHRCNSVRNRFTKSANQRG